MNGKKAKLLRRQAENDTIGRDVKVTRKVYKNLKKNYRENWRKKFIEIKM